MFMNIAMYLYYDNNDYILQTYLYCPELEFLNNMIH